MASTKQMQERAKARKQKVGYESLGQTSIKGMFTINCEVDKVLNILKTNPLGFRSFANDDDLNKLPYADQDAGFLFIIHPKAGFDVSEGYEESFPNLIGQLNWYKQAKVAVGKTYCTWDKAKQMLNVIRGADVGVVAFSTPSHLNIIGENSRLFG